MRGKWVFIDMIKGGLLALMASFIHGVFNGGVVSDSAPLLSSKHCKQAIKRMYNAHTHDQCCNVVFMVAMCGLFHLKEVCCKRIFKFTPNLNLKEVHMHICLCSPNLNWSNMKKKSIFRI